jgi:hypothetical protein
MGDRLQGALPRQCDFDADCPANLVCYDQTLSWTGNDSYCLCSTWYGWTLTTAVTASAGNSSLSTACILTTYANLSIVFFAVIALFFAWRIGLLSWNLNKYHTKKKWKNDLSFTLAVVYCFGWMLSGLARMIFLSLEFSFPEAQTLMPFGPTWKYSPYGIYQTKPLLAACTVFGMLVDYQIIVVWFSVATASTKMARGMKNLQFPLRIAIALFEISFLVGALILVFQDYITKFLYFCVAYFTLVIIGYGVAGYKLYHILMESLKKQPARAESTTIHLVQIGKQIKFTAITNAFLTLLQIVCSIAFGEANYQFKELGFAPAGLHHAGIAIMACQVYVITRYLQVSMSLESRRKNSASTVTSKSPPKAKDLNSKKQLMFLDATPVVQAKGEDGLIKNPNKDQNLGSENDITFVPSASNKINLVTTSETNLRGRRPDSLPGSYNNNGIIPEAAATITSLDGNLTTPTRFQRKKPISSSAIGQASAKLNTDHPQSPNPPQLQQQATPIRPSKKQLGMEDIVYV